MATATKAKKTAPKAQQKIDWNAPTTCKYCKGQSTYFHTSMNVGACAKPACIQKSMRDNL